MYTSDNYVIPRNKGTRWFILVHVVRYPGTFPFTLYTKSYMKQTKKVNTQPTSFTITLPCIYIACIQHVAFP